MQDVKPLILPRCYAGTEGEVIASELHGFCDASPKACGEVVFLRIVTTCASYVRFVSSKTRVAPLSEQTIPRLELLSAVVLSRLIRRIKEALSSEMKIDSLLCWTDFEGPETLSEVCCLDAQFVRSLKGNHIRFHKLHPCLATE